MKPSLLALSSWTSQSLEMWEKMNFFAHVTQSVVFCYTSLSRLKQYFMCSLKDESKFASTEGKTNGIRNKRMERRSKWRKEKR